MGKHSNSWPEFPDYARGTVPDSSILAKAIRCAHQLASGRATIEMMPTRDVPAYIVHPTLHPLEVLVVKVCIMEL